MGAVVVLEVRVRGAFPVFALQGVVLVQFEFAPAWGAGAPGPERAAAAGGAEGDPPLSGDPARKPVRAGRGAG
ncbi:hypothetical protein LJR013_002349 [Pseudarthrobacter oxydans]